MTPPLPYTFYACPCSDEQTKALTTYDTDEEQQQERTFNPHDSISAYSLYTLDHLLFCDECNQIRCAKCVSDEIINWYCPNCLFEVPSSGVKSEGNRCARNCYACPICASPLLVNQLDTLRTDADDQTYILSCNYCAWSSQDIDLTFDRPTKITDQLNKAHRARYCGGGGGDNTIGSDVEDKTRSTTARFETLTSFLKEQLKETNELHNSYGYGFVGSPANLARIMSLYGGLTHSALKKSQAKPRPMQEAGPENGLLTYDTESKLDNDLAREIGSLTWDEMPSQIQRMAAPINFEARTRSELWPVAIHLRTRRGKRCQQCRQFVIRPDVKHSTRYRLRIIAINHIPRLSLRPLDASGKLNNVAFRMKNEPEVEPALLQPHKPLQYVLTLRNPIFEPVKVTLATPAMTPGPVASKVTILCPSFTIGPAGDVWDDALSPTTLPSQSDGGRRAAMASLTGNNDADRQPEAGKVWEQTRNSTSVVLEIVPGAVPLEADEDDATLEIPVYVHVEWMAEVTRDGEQKGTAEKVAKELAYWCVLGAGQIAK